MSFKNSKSLKNLDPAGQLKVLHKRTVMIVASLVLAVATFLSASGVASASTFISPVGVYTGPGLGGVNNVFCQAIMFGINPLTGNPINMTAANPISKSVTRVDNANGSSDFEVTLLGDLPSSYLVADGYDCVWVDTNGDGLFTPGEAMRPYVSPGVAISGVAPNRKIVFQVNVPNAAGKAVCDKGSGINYTLLTSSAGTASGIETGSWLYFYSQTVCNQPPPSPVVPEVPYVPLFAAVAGLLGFVGMRNRMQKRGSLA